MYRRHVYSAAVAVIAMFAVAYFSASLVTDMSHSHRLGLVPIDGLIDAGALLSLAAL